MARVNVRNFTGLYLTRVEVNVHVRVHVVLLVCLIPPSNVVKHWLDF